MNARRKARREGNLRAIPTEARELSEHLGEMPDDEIECRAGYHPFALDTWKIGEDIPASVYARPGKDGRYELVSPCPNCGAKLIITTGYGGDLTGELHRRIDYPRTWYHLPAHLPRGKRTMRREKFSRGNAQAQVRALIRSSALVDEAEPAWSRGPVPPVSFKAI